MGTGCQYCVKKLMALLCGHYTAAYLYRGLYGGIILYMYLVKRIIKTVLFSIKQADKAKTDDEDAIYEQSVLLRARVLFGGISAVYIAHV